MRKIVFAVILFGSGFILASDAVSEAFDYIDYDKKELINAIELIFGEDHECFLSLVKNIAYPEARLDIIKMLDTKIDEKCDDDPENSFQWSACQMEILAAIERFSEISLKIR